MRVERRKIARRFVFSEESVFGEAEKYWRVLEPLVSSFSADEFLENASVHS